MPSVIVRWNGRCPDESVRESLCNRLRPLAELSAKNCNPPIQVRYWKRVVTGKILVDRALIHESATQDRPALEVRSVMERAQPPAPPNHLIQVLYLWVHGIEIRLPWNWYPEENRLSFMFAQQDEQIKLPWEMVRIFEAEQCKLYKNSEIASADYLVAPPEIHLRYHLEEWLDDLLGFIKHYYLPELHYWRYKDYPGYEKLTGIDRNNPRQREILWRMITEAYEAWVGQIRR